MGDSQEEFRRLSLNRLETMNKVLVEFIASRRGLSLFSLNCQSLRAHSADLTDSVVQRSNILLLSETWLRNDERIAIPNFDCVVQFKRPNVRAGGVAVYQKSNDTTNIVTAHMDMNVRQMNSLTVTSTVVGDICVARCVPENKQTILVVVVYISPNQAIGKIAEFIHETLLPYTVEGAALLAKNLHEIPMIMSGDFNVSFNSGEARPLIDFMYEKFMLRLNTDPSMATTRSSTTIDAVFARHLPYLESRIFVSYFSYHKPIVSFLSEDKPMELSE